MNATASETDRIWVQQCSCEMKHRYTSRAKDDGKGVMCQSDAPYRCVGSTTPAEGESYKQARYRAILTQFETVN